MNTNVIPLGVLPAPKISTSEFAGLICGTSQNIRAVLSKTGNFLGMMPVKLSSGRLLWDRNEALRVASGEVLPAVAAEAHIKKELAKVRISLEEDKAIVEVCGVIVKYIVDGGIPTVDEVLVFLKKIIADTKQNAINTAANFESFATNLRKEVA